ncbi:hypothetical protein PPERSA_00055 [Pseudocohnilembus persalinus]|uniref:Phospholipid/glycerol acyltransferase domain-containing protein n=1 Tax=Pseudocohnilembus persalinus TaxID=266149 RepID=A0A0V0Q8I2_PSEPJ|nr:hypothetical protein PPERSA_00055 [Pseudocohnilembus persalinus]|eukprot:KRW98563.1 hypothetical protein PPERSA_00055 [Pseudocohnilembus persalinus]
MSIFWYIILILWGVWALVMVKVLNKIIFKKYKYTEKLDPNIKENHKPFERYDRKNWNLVEIYLGAIFLLPIRTIAIVFFMLLLGVFCKVIGVQSTLEQARTEMSSFQRYSIRGFVYFVTRIILISSGFYYIGVKKEKITDYEPTYPAQTYKETKNNKASIIVCNHQSWIDIMLMTNMFQPSFLSKMDVYKYPLFGRAAVALQCLFVERESEEARQDIIQQIQTRGKNIKNGKNFAPILIFPEGTTTNGRYLLDFKKGAFEPGLPVKIMCVKYLPRNFNPALDSVDTLDNYILLASQFYNRVQVIELDNYYPDHLGITDYSKDWGVYAKAVKTIMVNVLKIKESSFGFRDSKEYMEVLKQRQKELRENGKKKI